MQIQTLKGFRDFLPKEAKARQWLKREIEEVFELWGFDPMETPTLEPLELFVGKIGEEEQLFFKFKDNAGREVALRYDQTVPTCRVVGQYAQELPMPFRRYQIQPAFRAEKPQKGRYREFVQCDADIFGESSYLADAEVIGLSLEIYRKLGFKNACVSVNDRELLTGIPYEAIVSIDKLEKIGELGVIREMIEKGIEREQAIKYFKQVQNLQPNERIKNIFAYLKEIGFNESWYKFEPTLSRSFSYSTGPIWEVKIEGFGSGSVLGGERYDGLVSKIAGVEIPGTGFGLGFDRTLEACQQFGLVPEFSTVSKVLVCLMGGEYFVSGLQAMKSLREAGIETEIYPSKEVKIDKQLKYANKKGIPYVLIIGADEVQAKKVSVKNMKSGEQKTVFVEDAIKIIKQGTSSG
jgi:histidyl-tRNA synthetase